MRLMRSIIWFTFFIFVFSIDLFFHPFSNKNQFKLFSLTLDGVKCRNEKNRSKFQSTVNLFIFLKLKILRNYQVKKKKIKNRRRVVKEFNK
jgi:hypothetical protein